MGEVKTMNTTTFNDTDIFNALENIDLSGIDRVSFVKEIEDMETRGGIVIVDKNIEKSSNIKSDDKPNTLRIFNTPIYISVAQIIENVKGDFFATIIKIISTITEDNSILTAAAKVLLPHIAVSIHLITNAEWCVYTTAVELYIRDSDQYYAETEFEPKFLGDHYCDNLELSCKYRRKDMCKIKKANVLKALNSLEGKHILERNEKNEYRYVRW